MMFAQLTKVVDTSSSHSGHGHGSMAWIAGVVIGAVVLLALLFGGIYWWRRRSQKRSSAQTGPQTPVRESQFMAKTSDTVYFEMQDGERRPFELQDPKSEGLLQHELQT